MNIFSTFNILTFWTSKYIYSFNDVIFFSNDVSLFAISRISETCQRGLGPFRITKRE